MNRDSTIGDSLTIFVRPIFAQRKRATPPPGDDSFLPLDAAGPGGFLPAAFAQAAEEAKADDGVLVGGFWGTAALFGAGRTATPITG